MSNIFRIIFNVIIVLLLSDLVILLLYPQNIRGWGERPSLEAHAKYGWRLKPNHATRLQWESYDYVVQSNSLGFPGPEYPANKAKGIFRIMTIGDAFTSAEGVDTNKSWPRLLEKDLNEQHPGQTYQVMNFGITGYGPIQYAAVVEDFIPEYKPDLLIIGFFVNDFYDAAHTTNEKTQDAIGFNYSSEYSLISVLKLQHLSLYIKRNVLNPLGESFFDTLQQNGYFLGNFSAFMNDPEKIRNEVEKVAERFKEIENIAKINGTKVVIMSIPASVQVCERKDLSYYPKNVNINDSNIFDLDLPQRLEKEIASKHHFSFYDLRPILKSQAKECVYQPRNMHWTEEGHKIAAQYLAEILSKDDLLH
jgi:lysophospholipase L1-like esterase